MTAYNVWNMEKFIKKIFYYTYRALYPRYGRNPKDAYFFMSLSMWISVLFTMGIVFRHVFRIEGGVVTFIVTFIFIFTYNYWIILVKRKYIDIILTSRARPEQCILYAILYNVLLPLFISGLYVFLA